LFFWFLPSGRFLQAAAAVFPLVWMGILNLEKNFFEALLRGLVVHELSLVCELVAALNESARENNIRRVERVRLVVGECYGALPEALAFAFRVLGEGTPCSGAVLEIETVPAVYRCRECGRQFGGGVYLFFCPSCGAGGAVLLRGRELYIDYYEGEEDPPAGGNTGGSQR